MRVSERKERRSKSLRKTGRRKRKKKLLESVNKAGYTATSCGRVGRGGNASFPTFQLERDGRTDGRTDKASYRVACPQLKRVKERQLKFKSTGKGKPVTCGPGAVRSSALVHSRHHTQQIIPDCIQSVVILYQK